MLSMLGKFSADDTLNYLYYASKPALAFRANCRPFAGKLHKMLNPFFWEKIRKIPICYLPNFAQCGTGWQW